MHWYKDRAQGFGGQGLILSSLLNDCDLLENVDSLIDYLYQGNPVPSIHSPGFRIKIVRLLSCVWLCDPMDCSRPGSSVLHYFLEFVQIHVHWVSDTIQPSGPLLSPSPPALSLSQHEGTFLWVDSLHQVAKVLELQLQSFQWEHWFVILLVTWYKLYHMTEFKKTILTQGLGTWGHILVCSIVPLGFLFTEGWAPG